MAVDWGATYSAAVPAIWQTARQTLEADPQKYKGKIKISSICCGGSAPPPEMMSWYKQEHGVIFAQGWGMTETSPMGTNGKPVTKHEHLSWTDAEQFRNVAVAGMLAVAALLSLCTDSFSLPAVMFGCSGISSVVKASACFLLLYAARPDTGGLPKRDCFICD